MKQSLGFVHLNFPNYVYKLKKTIYGLKHVPKAWFSKFSAKLFSIGFFGIQIRFVFLFLLIYADDFIITGFNYELFLQFTSSVRSIFSVKDLGLLHYFLGINVKIDTYMIFFSKQICIKPKQCLPLWPPWSNFLILMVSLLKMLYATIVLWVVFNISLLRI